MRRTSSTLFAAILALAALTRCAYLQSATSGILNVFSVRFSEGSPPVSGQTIAYSGSLLDVPSLDKFRLKMVFHVKADNSANKYKAAFGSDKANPVLNFRINSKSNDPVSTSIAPFSLDPGTVGNLDVPIEIPVSVLDRAMIRKIIHGDPIPYFLSGSLKFNLLEGTGLKGSSTSELDLTSGEISTRPSGSVVGLLSGLL